MYPAQVCTTPLGLPVDPLVYRMNSMSSASIASASTNGFPIDSTLLISSSHHTSRPWVMETGVRVCVDTITFSTEGHVVTASSTTDLSGITLVPRYAPSQVTTTLACASLIRSAMDWALNPPNTTECTAPIRAQASTAMANSGIIPMYKQTRSLF